MARPRRRPVSDPEVPTTQGAAELSAQAPPKVQIEITDLPSDRESVGQAAVRPSEHQPEESLEESLGPQHHGPSTWENAGSDRGDKAFGKARQRRFRSSKRSLSGLSFHDRLAATGVRHLYAPFPSKHKPQSYRISFSTLQRMVIHDLQRKLVLVVKRIIRRQEVPVQSLDRAKELLAEYTTAIRDYDFMTEKFSRTSESGDRDPFTLTTEDALTLYLLRESLLVPKNEKGIHAQDRADFDRYRNILPGSSRTELNSRLALANMWRRIWMGMCGGLALIAPMLLMVLHNNEVTSLITTSVATMLFAFLLAVLGKDLKGQEVLASVAAYAAVLVVFVGTSS